jgi:hypothetical protein
MGDIALVIFKDAHEFSPTVYLHWGGSDVPDLIAKTAELMANRLGDVQYCCARFIGICHEQSPKSATGLGVWSTDPANLETPEAIAEYSHGDAGVIIVDCRDFTWTAHAGYLAKVPA